MAIDPQEYKNQLSGGEQTDDYFNLAREGEYSTMLDKEIQLENSKAQAMKYTNNQINAQGMGGTGYGSSINAGIQSQYLNQVNKAKEDYNAGIKEINAQENQQKQAQANDRFESVTTLISESNDQAKTDKMLSDYGYGTIDEETGEFKWNETKPEGMSDDDWIQMKYIYENQKGQFDAGWLSNNTLNGTGFSDFASTQGKTEAGIDIHDKKWGVDYELRYLLSEPVMKNAKNGDAVQLINGNSTGGQDYVYMIYHNGKWYQTDAQVYSQSQHQGVIQARNAKDWQSASYEDIFNGNLRRK